MRLTVLSLVFLLALLPTAARVSAQSQEALLEASARAFFREGVALADEGRMVEAADRFRRALSIRYSPVIAYNLASMLEEQGELVEACDLLRRVEADEGADDALRASAKQLVVAMEPKLARLTIHIHGSVRAPVVHLDDIELMPVQLGAPIPVDPQAHTLRLHAGQRLLEERALSLGEAESLVVTLGAPAALSPAAVAAASQAGQRERDMREGSVVRSPWFWAGVGVVVVGAVAVAGYLILSGGSGGTQTLAM